MVAIRKIKSTYALDVETVSRLEEMARRWGVSKSEVLRRAVRAAAGESRPAATDAVSALDELQRSLPLSRAQAHAWAQRSRAERHAAVPRRRRSRG
jgi:Ribbon-helix-helix protein, copG family